MGFKFAGVSAKLADRNVSSQIIEHRYYGLLNWVRNEFKNVQKENKSKSLMNDWRKRLFGESMTNEIDLSPWEDPYGGIKSINDVSHKHASSNHSHDSNHSHGNHSH